MVSVSGHQRRKRLRQSSASAITVVTDAAATIVAVDCRSCSSNTAARVTVSNKPIAVAVADSTVIGGRDSTSTRGQAERTIAIEQVGVSWKEGQMTLAFSLRVDPSNY